MTHTRTRRRGVHASAVGHGIAHAIFATEAEPHSPEEWVHLCCTAADEAEHAVADAPEQHESESMRVMRELCDAVHDADTFTTADLMEQRAACTTRRTPAMIEAGAAAFTACMPKVTGRRNTQAYIACVAVGLQRQYFTGGVAKALLYTAQLALSAHPSRRAGRGRKAN